MKINKKQKRYYKLSRIYIIFLVLFFYAFKSSGQEVLYKNINIKEALSTWEEKGIKIKNNYTGDGYVEVTMYTINEEPLDFSDLSTTQFPEEYILYKTRVYSNNKGTLDPGVGSLGTVYNMDFLSSTNNIVQLQNNIETNKKDYFEKNIRAYSYANNGRWSSFNILSRGFENVKVKIEYGQGMTKDAVEELIIPGARISFQDNIITLSSKGSGDEGFMLYTDGSEFSINDNGDVSVKNPSDDDWDITSGTIGPSGARNGSFKLIYGGMANVNTNEGNDYGKLITPGGIDRSSNGALGVRDGGGNGINNNQGFTFGLDLSEFNLTETFQISKIYVSLAGGSNETGVIVNSSSTSERITFGNKNGVDVRINNSENSIDITSLDVYLVGGEINETLLSVFNTSTTSNNFRINGVELKVATDLLNLNVIKSTSHPRVLLRNNELSKLYKVYLKSPEFNQLNRHIIDLAEKYVTDPEEIIMPETDKPARFLNMAQLALKQIFYLSYSYRFLKKQAATFKTSKPNAEVALLNKADRLLDRAETLLNNISNFDSWTNKESQNLETAEMCLAAAIGYDWLYNDLSENTKQNVRNAIVNFGLEHLKDEPFWDVTSNWNQVCIASVAIASIAIYQDGTNEMDNIAEEILSKTLEKNQKSLDTYANGNYPEGPFYWSYGSTFQVMLLSTLEKLYGANNKGIEKLTNTPGFLESAEYMQFANGPTSMYFNYFDGNARKVALPAAFWMAKKLNNSSLLSEEKMSMNEGIYYKKNAEDRYLPLAMVYGKDINIDNLNNPTKKLWVGYGSQPVAMVRTKWNGSTGNYFGLKAGTADYSHGHMDAGSFVYDTQGLRWGLDFGKYNYGDVNAKIKKYLTEEGIEIPETDGSITSDRSQDSYRWVVFKTSNISHNTISIKKTSESTWQRHKVDGFASIIETFDGDAKRGAKVDLSSVIGLNNELDDIKRSVYIVNEDYLEVKDEINNGNQEVDIYWNMATTATASKMGSNKIKLTQAGKTTLVEVISSNNNVVPIIEIDRSTNPDDYSSPKLFGDENKSSRMIGFTAKIPSNQNVNFTVTIKNGDRVTPLTDVLENEILLEIPNPSTGNEGNKLYKDSSVLHIDTSGNANITGLASDYAWQVFGNTNNSATFNNYFKFSWAAIARGGTISGVNEGAMFEESGIDRNSSGDLGVRMGEGGAINQSQGFKLGLDLTQLPNSVSIQLLKVGVSTVGKDEKGVIVNRNDLSKRITFGGSNTSVDVNVVSSGMVNVENLDIILKGGFLKTDLASIMNNGGVASGFTLNKFVFKVIPTTSSKTSNKKEVLNTEDNDLDNLQIYPNPFNDFITIRGFSKNTSESVNYKIFDVLGNCVLDREIDTRNTKNEIKIPLSHLAKGIYLLNIKIGEQTKIKKIMKTY